MNRDIVEELLTKINNTSEPFDKTEHYVEIITYCWQQSAFKECRKYCSEALLLTQDNQDNKTMSFIYRILGNIEVTLANYDIGLEYYLTSLSLAESIDDKTLIANCLNNIGNIYNFLHDYDNALYFYNRSRETREAVNDIQSLPLTLNNIGLIYASKAAHIENSSEKENYQELALGHFTQASGILQTNQEDYQTLISISNSKGKLLMEMGHYDLAYETFKDVLALCEKHDLKKNITFSLSGLANYCIVKNRFSEAITYFLNAINYAIEFETKDKLKELYLELSELYAKLDNYDNAYKYQKLYVELTNTIFNEQMQNRISEFQARFEIEQKEKEKEIYRFKNIELAQAYNEIDNQKKELERLNESKNEFLGIVVHDLRNPIACIMGLCDLMMDNLTASTIDSSGLIKDLVLVKNTSVKMNQLVHELLDISAIESGKITLYKFPYYLVLIIFEREYFYNSLAQKKNIDFSIAEKYFDKQVLFDKDRIVEVLDNLTTNAIKYTQPGGKVRIEFEIVEKNFIVHIKDTGQGFSEREIQQVFHDFKKFSATPTAGESTTGFGLLIVKKIIDIHQGKIWLESIQGQGSTFSFSLPLL